MVCATSLEACQVVCLPQSAVAGVSPQQQPSEQLLTGKELAAVAPTPLVQAPVAGCAELCYYVIAVPVDANAVPCGSAPMAIQALPQVDFDAAPCGSAPMAFQALPQVEFDAAPCDSAPMAFEALPQMVFAFPAQEPQKALPGELAPGLCNSQLFQNQWWPADITDQSLCETTVPAEGFRGARRGPGSALPRRQRRQRAAQQQEVQRPAVRRDAVRSRPKVADTGLAAELIAQLEAGGESCREALLKLQEPGLMRRLSFGAAGCRTVQLALELADRSSAAKVAAGLQGAVVEAIQSPHANYVIQKIIAVLSPQEAPFIAEEIQGAGPGLSCHEYGCRVFCRLLENAAADQTTVRLIDGLLAETEALLTDIYGHHAVEAVLEHGLARQRSQIVSALRKGVMHVAQNRTGAYVLEKALLYGSSEDQEALASDILAAPTNEIEALTRSQMGCMVIRAMLRLPPWVAQHLRQHLSSAALLSQLESTKHGRRLLAATGLSSSSESSDAGAREEEREEAGAHMEWD